MKILFINTVCDYGSTGRIVRSISDELKKQGNQVLICYGRKPLSEGQDSFYFGNDMQTMIHGLMTRFLGRHGLHSNSATRKLIAKIKEFSPDVIHLHNLHGYYLNVPILFNYLKEANIRVVWTLHDCWSISGSGAHFDYFGCKEWDEGCVVCNETKSYPSSIFIKGQRRNFKWKKSVFTQLPTENMTIVTPSDWLKDLMKTSFLKKYEIVRVYNGIDTNIFKPIDFEKDDRSDVVNILGVANAWDEKKGLFTFIELSKRLSENFKVTLIGLDDKQVSLVSDRIHAVKRTRDVYELAKYYSMADIYVNLSVEETMGMTTIEAIASGTPVIVYNATAVPEVVTPEVGVVIEKNDIEKLIETIESFNYASYDKSVLFNYASNFTDKKMIDAYVSLIAKNRS